jgi:Ferritin-like domain
MTTNSTPSTDSQSPDSKVMNRRSALQAVVGVAGAAAATVLLSATTRPAFGVTPALTFADIPGTGDVKVLNFALALEDLEANLYVQALQRLTNGGTSSVGKKITGLNINANAPDAFYLREFGIVETQHRDFIRGALGAAAIKPFKYDFQMETLTRKQVLNLVYSAEKLGTAAYLGAITSFTTKAYLQTAGAIQGTEARHTAVIAEILNELYAEGLAVAPLSSQFGGSNNGIETPIDPNTVLKTVSPFIVV